MTPSTPEPSAEALASAGEIGDTINRAARTFCQPVSKSDIAAIIDRHFALLREEVERLKAERKDNAAYLETHQTSKWQKIREALRFEICGPNKSLVETILDAIAERDRLREVEKAAEGLVEALKGYRIANSLCRCIHCKDMDIALAAYQQAQKKAKPC